jgi:hypothetical protein
VSGLGDLEYRAVVVRPAAGRRAKEVAVGIGDQAGRRGGTVSAVEVD